MPDDPAILLPPHRRRPFLAARTAPSAPVAAFVEHLWTVDWDVPDGEAHHQEVLSYPVVHLTVEESGSWVYGVPTARFLRELSGRGWVVGARFRAGGFAAQSRVPPGELVNTRAPAAEVFGGWVPELAEVAAAATSELRAAALDRVLAGNGRPPGAESALVERAIALVAEDRSLVRVGELAARLGCATRTLQRRFGEHLGVHPKWVLRRQRIHDALDRMQHGERVAWAELAAELGFADQAHFNHVFRELVGVPPAAYRRRLTGPG